MVVGGNNKKSGNDSQEEVWNFETSDSDDNKKSNEGIYKSFKDVFGSSNPQDGLVKPLLTGAGVKGKFISYKGYQMVNAEDRADGQLENPNKPNIFCADSHP